MRNIIIAHTMNNSTSKDHPHSFLMMVQLHINEVKKSVQELGGQSREVLIKNWEGCGIIK